MLLQLGLGSALAARGNGHSGLPCHGAVAPAHTAHHERAHPHAEAPAHTQEQAQEQPHAQAHANSADTGQAQGDKVQSLSHHCCATGVGSAVAWQGPSVSHSPPQAVRLGAAGRTLAPDLRPPIA